MCSQRKSSQQSPILHPQFPSYTLASAARFVSFVVGSFTALLLLVRGCALRPPCCWQGAQLLLACMCEVPAYWRPAVYPLHGGSYHSSTSQSKTFARLQGCTHTHTKKCARKGKHSTHNNTHRSRCWMRSSWSGPCAGGMWCGGWQRWGWSSLPAGVVSGLSKGCILAYYATRVCACEPFDM